MYYLKQTLCNIAVLLFIIVVYFLLEDFLNTPNKKLYILFVLFLPFSPIDFKEKNFLKLTFSITIYLLLSWVFLEIGRVFYIFTPVIVQ